MKLSKKLLPLTGIVTSFAVVAPITACSNNSVDNQYLAKATSFKYSPDAKAAKGKIVIDDTTKWDAMQKSYFSDKTRVAQDACYIAVQELKGMTESLEEEKLYSINFEITINSLNIGAEKIASWEDELGETVTQKGFVFSIDFDLVAQATYFADKEEYFEITEDMPELQKEKIIQWRNRTTQIFMETHYTRHTILNNYFAYLDYDWIIEDDEPKLVPTLVIEPHDIEGVSWEQKQLDVDTEVANLTFVDGQTYVDSEVYKDHIYYAKEIGDTIEEMEVFHETGAISEPSFYLSNVEVTLE